VLPFKQFYTEGLGRPSVITPEMSKGVIKDYIFGMPAAEILKKYNISRSTLYRILNKFNTSNINRPKLSPQGRPSIITPEMSKGVIKDYIFKTPAAEILKKYNISHTTLYKILDKFNVSNIKHPKLSPQEQEGVIKDYKAGMPLAEIEKKYNIIYKTIYRTLYRNNIKINLQHKQYTNLDSQEQESMIKDYKAGMPVVEIVKKYNISITTIYKTLNSHNIKPNQHYNILTLQKQESIIKDYNAGMSTAEILKKYNISSHTLYKILNKFNVSYIKRRHTTQQEQEGIIKDYKAGMPLAEILKKYNISSITLYNTLNRHNIKSNRIKTIQ